MTGEVKDSNLWMDSAELKLVGKKKFGRKSSKWSYKEQSPGRRYMILRDGQDKIRRVWGGYSPKRHDGTFLSDNKAELDQTLAGAVILADNHFSKGKNLIGSIKFYTNFAKKINFRAPSPRRRC